MNKFVYVLVGVLILACGLNAESLNSQDLRKVIEDAKYVTYVEAVERQNNVSLIGIHLSVQDEAQVVFQIEFEGATHPSWGKNTCTGLATVSRGKVKFLPARCHLIRFD